jgi:hypothetical protein
MSNRSCIIRKIFILEDEETGFYSVYSINQFNYVDDVNSYETIDECWKHVKSIAKASNLNMEDIEFNHLWHIICDHLEHSKSRQH